MIKKTFKLLKQKIFFLIKRILLYIFRIFPIDNQKVFCMYFDGKGLGDSPKYIVEELLTRKNYHIIWALNKTTKNDLPINIDMVRIGSLNYFYHLATSKIIINSNRFPTYFIKRKRQYYVQTWHGSLMLKKIEFDVEDKLNKEYVKMMHHDNKMIDAIISNSKFTTNLYRNTFKYNGKILEYGIPRNDVLINNQNELKKQVYNYFNLEKDTKILLYAPTFRENYEHNPYDIDFKKIKKILEIKTKSKWSIIIKLHPLVNRQDLIKKDFIYIDANNYSDIQELLCACDILITDYSSLMFDALIAKKITILYANDIDSYIDERGFYFELDKLPFPLTKNNNELINILNKYNENEILTSYKKFSETLEIYDDGKASIRVADLIEKQMKK